MANDYYTASSTVNSVGEYINGQQISDTATTSLDQKVMDPEKVLGFTDAAAKYKVGTFCYPLDLMDPKAGNVNHVRFYINIQSDSKAETENTDMGAAIGPAPNIAAMNSIVGKSFSSGSYAVGKAIGGVDTGALVGGALGGNLKGALAGALGGAALSGGKAVATTTVLSDWAGVKFGQPSKRLAGFIALYMPNQLSTRYSMSWQDEEMDLAAVVASSPELAQQLEAVKESAGKGNIKEAAGGATGIAGSIIGAEVLKKNASLSVASRTAANPRKEQVFKGVDYRRFQFEYQFAPRNPTEAQQVLDIIKQFKYHMHPEFKEGSSNFMYVYPSEFDIEYFFGSDQNQRIHKVSSCVLTEMNINYSPNGVFSTFPDGTPTQINVQMSFTELELLTKNRIMAGL